MPGVGTLVGALLALVGAGLVVGLPLLVLVRGDGSETAASDGD